MTKETDIETSIHQEEINSDTTSDLTQILRSHKNKLYGVIISFILAWITYLQTETAN